MNSIRKWIFKPKRSDQAHLAQFYFADEELNVIANELDSFDGRKDPERCATLVNQLRHSQDNVLGIVEKIMAENIPKNRSSRDYRVKFPDDVLQESLAGQLWFGAECLAAGSSIMNREVESASMRPLAMILTKHLDVLRSLLREQCLKNQNTYTDKIREALIEFDKLFSEFELSYVSAMVPVKTMKEYDLLQEVMVLFCETVQRALRLGLLSQDQLDAYDPALMFTIPRLAIVCGLLVYPEGPLNPDMDPVNMSEMFRQFQILLYKIRELLWTLNKDELWMLEKLLCSADEPGKSEFMSNLHPDLGLSSRLPPVGTESSPATDDKLEQPDEQDDDSSLKNYGLVVHSESTMTVVAGAQQDNSVEGSAGSPALAGLPAEDKINSDSSDGDGSGDDEPVPGAMVLSDADARRLQHSKSWPQSGARSPSASEAEGASAVVSRGHNIDFLSNTAATVARAVRSLSWRGSREFNFTLPYNTGEADGMILAAAEDNDEHAEPPGGQQVIYMLDPHVEEDEGGSDSDQTDVSHPNQISFITDTFCQLFYSGDDVSNEQNDAKVAGDGSHVDQREADAEESVAIKVIPCDCNVDTATTAPREAQTVCNGQVSASRQSSEPSPAGSSIVGTLNSRPQLEELETAKIPSNHSGQNGKAGICSKNESLQRKVVGAASRRRQCRLVMDGAAKVRLTQPESILCNKTGAITTALNDISNNLSAYYNSPSNSHSGMPNLEYDWDRESYCSSETSSYTSENHDDEEIAMAIQAAEVAARQEARSRFKSSTDLIHRLFVCISAKISRVWKLSPGVADQLQTNYASDLRHILKTVFECNTSSVVDKTPDASPKIQETQNDDADFRDRIDDVSLTDEESSESQTATGDFSRPAQNFRNRQRSTIDSSAPPQWIPDEQTTHCMSCKVAFTFVRRRHHCRNCGKIFCGHCSSNSVPLPHYGHEKPVRVCNHCFMFHVTPFTIME